MKNRLMRVLKNSFVWQRCQFLFSKLAKRPLLSSFFIILISSIVFGLWVKVKQLTIVSEKLLNYYPLAWYAIPILKSLLIFGVLWLFLTLISLLIEQKREALTENLLICSLPFVAFWLGPLSLKLLYQVGLFLLFSFIIVLRRLSLNKPIFNRIKGPLLVLLAFVSIYLVLFVNLSPLYRSHIFNMWGRNDFLLQLEYHWDNAKAYDFLGTFTQRCNLGGYAQHTLGVSQLSSFLVLLFNIPLVDLMGKYAAVHFIYFAFYTFAAYGGYLFLRYGLKLSFLPSFIGGLGIILSNTAFLSFNNTEWSIHQMQFLFFPWVLFFLNQAYSFKKPAWVFAGICLAGLVASLSEYVMSSQAESQLQYTYFFTLYNIYLAFVLFARNRFRLRSLPHLVANIAILPFMYALGFAIRVIPLFEALISREFTLYPLYAKGSGLPWDYSLAHWSTFFFRIPDGMINTRLSWVQTIAGPQTYFFTGYFILPLIYCFFIGLCFYILKLIFRKKIETDENVIIKHSLFFSVIFLILAINLPIGSHSWLSVFMKTRFMKFIGVYGVNHFVRLNVYYQFFVWVVAMFGLHYLLEFKKIKILTIGFISCPLSAILAYRFLPVPKIPEGIFIDGFILVTTYFLIRSFIKTYNNSRRQYLLSFLLIFIAFVSFFTIYKQISKVVIKKSNWTLSTDNIFTSFRTAVTSLRNNQHDIASFKYLDRRVNKFLADINFSKQKKSAIEEKYYNKVKDILRVNTTDRIKLFETLAPEIDNFYIDQGSKLIAQSSTVVQWGPLVVDNNNAVQFYLPDNYNHLALYNFYGAAVGKNCDFVGSGTSDYSIGGALPTIYVNYYLRDLWSGEYLFDTYRVKIYRGLFPFSLDHLLSNKSDKKLLNICGVDYILYPESIERSRPYSDASATLKSMGFLPVELPESFRFAENLKINVFRNPQSYGKAYFAKWVRVIKPSDILANDSKTYSYFNHWPLFEDLDKDFKYHISQIPDSIDRAALVESSDPTDYSNKPYLYKADNQVKIVKILASKAVFDVECKEDNCWFIYNSAALKGWKAFSGSQPLPIHKANLGFIGLKLDKGKHFVWMEYRQFPATIGFLVTFCGWILIFLFFIVRLSKDRGSAKP